MTRFRAQREASPLRADIAALEEELLALTKKKLSLVHLLRGNSAALRSFLLSGDDASIEDISAKDGYIISQVEENDFLTAACVDRICAATGIDRSAIGKKLFLKNAAGKEIVSVRKEIESVLRQTSDEREELAGLMEKKCAALKRSADELEAIAAMRKYTPSKDPLL